MNKIIYKSLLSIRAKANRMLKSKENYWTLKSTQPLSRKFGLDRGTPIDRFYIGKFIFENRKSIRGVCLEIGDDRYASQYNNKIKKLDILDINKKNKLANIYADLRNMPQIIDSTYDCIILTQVLGMVDDVNALIKECHRILKPGGALLLTTSFLSPAIEIDSSYWRFGVAGVKYLLSNHFKQKNIDVTSMGNVLSGQSFYVGMVQEDLETKDLEFNDPQFPLIITGRAIK